MVSLIYDNFDYVYHRLLRHVNEHTEYVGATRGVPFKEVLNVSFQLTDPRNNVIQSSTRKPNQRYAEVYADYICNGGMNEEELIKLNPKVKRYLSDKHVEGTVVNYGARIADQLPQAMELLKHDRHTRRAVIHILRPEDHVIAHTYKATMEYPCAESIHLLIRNDKLCMVVNMRSQNVALTIVYDVYNFTSLQLYIAERLGIRCGDYFHNMASAHFYQKEQELVDKILDEHFLPK